MSSTRRDHSHWEQQGRGRGSGRAGQAGRQVDGQAGRRVRRTGRGIGRRVGNGKGKEAAPIEVSSSDDVLSEKSIATEDEIWIEKAMEKRRRRPTIKAAEAAEAKAEAEKAAIQKAAEAQAEIDLWEL